MNVYLRLFIEFFKTGLFAVGGGMATLPFLQEMGERTGWFTYGDLMNMLAVSESTPALSALIWRLMWDTPQRVRRELLWQRWVR